MRASCTYFNSRPSARGDVSTILGLYLLAISIHAPPRGATFSACKEIIMERSFQFTPLREGRLDIRLLRSRRCYFNSRPSARGDAVRRGRRPERGRISIHAPPRGATSTSTSTSADTSISIHAPPRGATLERRAINQLNRISIHAPPRGATRPAYAPKPIDLISIHAPPRGATEGGSGR